MLPSLPTLSHAVMPELPSLGGSRFGVPVARGAIKALGSNRSEAEEEAADGFLGKSLSALGYIGSQFDALLGRRTRAAGMLLSGRYRPGVIGELFTVPVVSDLVGWSDRGQMVTGKELLDIKDNPDSYWDDVAGIATEIVSDPTTFMTGGATGLFGAATKGQKLVKNAGVMDDVAKIMSAKLGRKVGRREAMSRATLKDINVYGDSARVVDTAAVNRMDEAAKAYGFDTWKQANESSMPPDEFFTKFGSEKGFASAGTPTRTVKIGADAEKRLSDAAKGMGFENFAQAQEKIGDQPLQAMFGFTPIPMASTPKYVIPGNERWMQWQAKLDRFGDKASENPMLRQWRRMFDKDVRESDTALGQREIPRSLEELNRANAAHTKRMTNTQQRLSALGIDRPEFESDIRAAVERTYFQAPKGTAKAGKRGLEDMDIHVHDRNPDEIVKAIFDLNNSQPAWKLSKVRPKVGDHAQWVKQGIKHFQEPRVIEEISTYRTGASLAHGAKYQVRFKGSHEFIPLTEVRKAVQDGKVKNKYSTRGFTPDQMGEIRAGVSEFVHDTIKTHADLLERAHSYGVGSDEVNSFTSAYLARAARPVEAAAGRELKAPKFVTPDMMRQLQSPRVGYNAAKIAKLEARSIDKHGDVRDLYAIAYPQKEFNEAFTARQAKELKMKPIEPGSHYLEDIINTDSKSWKKRAEVMNNIPGTLDAPAGTPIWNLLTMDSRLSGALAGAWRQNPTDGSWGWVKYGRKEKQQILYEEFFKGNWDAIKQWEDLKEARSLPKVNGKYGVFGRYVGKGADDVIEDETARDILVSVMGIEQHAMQKSGDIIDMLSDINPLHVVEQRPVFADDAVSIHLAMTHATEEAIHGAHATQRMLYQAADNTIDADQANTVLESLSKAGVALKDKRSVGKGYHAKSAEVLRNMIRVAAEDGRDEWEVFGQKMSADDIMEHLGENPHERITRAASEPTYRDVEVSGATYKKPVFSTEKVENPDWLDFETKRAKVLIQFGLNPAKLSTKTRYEPGVTPSYKALVKAAMKQRGVNTPSELGKETLASLTQQAKLKSQAKNPVIDEGRITKLYRENFDLAEKMGVKPYRVHNDVLDDTRNAMSLAKTPMVFNRLARFTDKLTNTMKTHFTTTWLPFVTRNLQTLGIMDFLVNSDNVLDPREVVKAYGRWRDSYRFHSGKRIDDLHSIPLFSDIKWPSVKNPEWKQGSGLPKMIKMTGEQKDEIVTNMLRSEYASAHVANSRGVGEMIQDMNIQGIDNGGIKIAELVPGTGRNVKYIPTVGQIAEKWKGVFSKMKDGEIGYKEILGQMNPVDLRGGFTKNARNDRSKFFLARWGENASSYSETIGRTATWLGQLKKGVDPLKAAARSNAAHVDYNSLSTFERQYMRRLVPFYTYQRKMIPYMMRTMLEHPGGAVPNMIRTVNIASAERDDKRFTPQQLAGQLAIPLYNDNTGATAYLKPDLPINVLNNMFTIGGSTYETIQNTGLGWMSQMHMIPKAMIETFFGKSTFQKGRNLEDMYSRIGIKDPVLNQIVMTSPLSRYVTTFGPRGRLLDSRSPVAERFFTHLTGQNVAHIDLDKSQEEALDQAINKALSLEEGIGHTEQYYAYDEEALTPRAKALMDMKNKRSKGRMDAGRKKKAAQAKPEQPLVFPSLPRL